MRFEQEWEFDDNRTLSLIAQLPRDSRTWFKIAPGGSISDSLRILRSAEHSLRVLSWMKTTDAQKTTPRHYPLAIETEGELIAKLRESKKAPKIEIKQNFGGAVVDGVEFMESNLKLQETTSIAD